ncbi:hypothetical protein MBANPS3_011437 [Mucor bainieri]
MIAILFASLARWIVALNPYSGFNTPPMFGDYEAQHHWMEITTHLHTSKWYRYDLQWWGLDYPPLTAFHSWLCGIIGSRIGASWFALDTFRGIDTESSKLFMRSTVFVSEALIYMPAVLVFCQIVYGSNGYLKKHMAAVLILMQPALIMIDHAHFQCVQQPTHRTHCVFTRIFPVARGLYEDKVANVWCAVKIVDKLRQIMTVESTVQLRCSLECKERVLALPSLLATLVVVIPVGIYLGLAPSRRQFLYAMINSSLGFFLFSFQVHEKSILLPLMPVTLLVLEEPIATTMFINVAMFSMFPLLQREGLMLPYFITSIMWNWLVGGYSPTACLAMRLGTLVSVFAVASAESSHLLSAV